MNSNILNLRHLTVLFILCTAFLGGAIPAFAQQGGKKMTGQVIDENKEPMIGVSILIVGTSTGTVTDFDGNYTLNVPKDSKELQFSYVGYETKVIAIPANGNVLNVQMKSDSQVLSDVVVIGYGTQRKSDLTGSVTNVSSKDFNMGLVSSPEQLINGKISGVQIMSNSGSPTSGSTIRVRGGASLNASNDPLIVLDGVPLEQGGISGNDGNFLSLINPNDIETFTVLKDASATVMYGVKAANGVILIKTKQGQAGRMSVNYSGDISITPRLTYEKMNLMNSKERVDVSREIYERGLTSDNRPLESIGYEGALGRYLAKEISYDEFNDEVKKLESTNTDWFKLLFRNSVSMNHSLSISGGTDKISYYGSVNATINRGTSIGNESTSYSAAIGINAKFGEKVNLGLRINGSTSRVDGRC